MLNPIHLRTFVEVMHTGSFAVAARKLGYTASAVSQQVSALERQLDCDLFERGPRGIRATPAARMLLDDAHDVLGGLKALEDTIARVAAGDFGLLRIGSFPTASQRLVPETLSRLLVSHPGMIVELDEAEPQELLALLDANEIDIAMTYRYDMVPETSEPWWDVEPLLIEKLSVIVPADHRLAASEAISLSELADEQWITTRRGTAAAELVQRLCAYSGFTPSVRHQSNDYEVVHALVRAKLGVAVIPALGYTPSADTVSIDIDDDRAVRRVFCIQRSDRHASARSLFIEAMHETARALAQSEPRLTPTLRSRPA